MGPVMDGNLPSRPGGMPPSVAAEVYRPAEG